MWIALGLSYLLFRQPAFPANASLDYLAARANRAEDRQMWVIFGTVALVVWTVADVVGKGLVG